MKTPDWIKELTDQSRILGARVFRDGEPVTLPGRAEVIKRLLELLENLQRSRDWAAKSMGIPMGKLANIITGQESGDEGIRNVDKWIESQVARRSTDKPKGFIKTRVAEQVYAAARCIMAQGSIALVHGQAGIGKTYCARAVQAETPGSLFISIKTAGQTAKAVLDELAGLLRVGEQRTRWRLFTAIEGVLADSNRLLVVDEVHKLTGRRHDEALHCLRDLHDACRIPMLWLGMSNLATYIREGHSRGYEPLDQLFSRIALWVDLTEQAEQYDGGPGLATIEDIRAMIAARQLRITRDGEEYLLALARASGGGAYRTVQKLLEFAQRVAQDKEISSATLRSLQAARLGVTTNEFMERQMGIRALKVGA